MLTDAEFERLLLERSYYFADRDIIYPATTKRLKATLLNIDGKEFWIPNSVAKRLDIVNKKTGEIIQGWLVKRDFIKKSPKKKLLRSLPLDYDPTGSFVRLSDGWTFHLSGDDSVY